MGYTLLTAALAAVSGALIGLFILLLGAPSLLALLGGTMAGFGLLRIFWGEGPA